MVSKAEREAPEKIDERRPTDHVVDPVSEIDGDDTSGYASALETLSITVDLPAPVRSPPAEEIAVSIPDVAVDPGSLDAVEPSTRSIDVTALAIAGVTALVTVDIPDRVGDTADHPYSRRDRLRGEPSSTPEPAAMLTAERLLGTGRGQRPKPEGA